MKYLSWCLGLLLVGGMGWYFYPQSSSIKAPSPANSDGKEIEIKIEGKPLPPRELAQSLGGVSPGEKEKWKLLLHRGMEELNPAQFRLGLEKLFRQDRRAVYLAAEVFAQSRKRAHLFQMAQVFPAFLDGQLLRRLRKTLMSGDALHREMACYALLHCGDRAVVGAVASRYLTSQGGRGDEGMAVRFFLENNWKKLTPNQRTAVRKKAMTESFARDIRRAGSALQLVAAGKINPVEGKKIQTLLDSPHPDLAIKAAQALARSGFLSLSQLVPYLKKILERLPDKDPRRATIQAWLGQVKE